MLSRPVLCCAVPCAAQLKDLAATIAAMPCDAVLLGTPHDLTRVLDIPHPVVRVTYSVTDVSRDVMERLQAAPLGGEVGAEVGSAADLVKLLTAFVKAH